MKIVLPGGSGLLGRLLAGAFARDGHQIVILSPRSASSSPWRTVEWDAVSLGAWTNEIDDADVVINLAARSINCRCTPTHRDESMSSRIPSTRVLARTCPAS